GRRFPSLRKRLESPGEGKAAGADGDPEHLSSRESRSLHHVSSRQPLGTTRARRDRGSVSSAPDERKPEVTMGTRREFLAGATGLAATIAAGGCAASSRPGVATRRRAMFAYVGCYTSKERNG